MAKQIKEMTAAEIREWAETKRTKAKNAARKRKKELEAMGLKAVAVYLPAELVDTYKKAAAFERKKYLAKIQTENNTIKDDTEERKDNEKARK